MAEFYMNPPGSRDWDSGKPVPKKSLLESSLDHVLTKADELLKDALELAKSGRAQAKEEIEERIKAYTLLASITPSGPDAARITDVRKQFEYNRQLKEFEIKLKKDIFG